MTPSAAEGSGIDVRLLAALLQAGGLVGASIDRILSEIGLNGMCLDVPGSRVTLRQFEEAIGHVSKSAGLGPVALGSYAAKIIFLEGLPFQLFSISRCKTLRVYLRMSPNIDRMYGDVGTLSVNRRKGDFEIEWHPYSRSSLGDRFLCHAFLGLAALNLQTFCVRPLPIAKTSFSEPKPVDCGVLRVIFGEDLHFDQSRNCIHICRDAMDSLTIQASIDWRADPARIMSELTGDRSVVDPFVMAVRGALAGAMATGNVTVDVVAKRLNMSRRSLQRNLERRNTGFLMELQETRSQLSARYLKETQLAVTQIAFMLGYMDQTSFSTAFKSWFGQSPSEFRKASSPMNG